MSKLGTSKEFLKAHGVDMVNNPPHYKDASGIECIEATRHMQFCGGSCFKYLYRCGSKWDDIEDLKKAAWYARSALEIREKVSRYPSDLIWRIAEHREGNIRKARQFAANYVWDSVERAINAEIAKLEAESNQ